MADERASTITEALQEAGALGDGEHVVELEQFVSGWSRHSFLAVTPSRRFVVRVKPPGALLDTDLALEYRVYGVLERASIPAPRVHHLDASLDTPFGGPFFVMDYVDGWAPNMYKPAERAQLEADWSGPRTIAEDMVGNLARIHTLPPGHQPDGVAELDYDTVVGRWRQVYEDKRLVRDPVIEEAFDWLVENPPADERTGLVHGDYRVGNTLIADARVQAVLDWELTYRGDVRFDLGYLLLERSAGKHLRSRGHLMGCFAEEGWFLERYGELTGAPVQRESLRVFEMLAILMLTATQVTAAWMYRNGRTTDFRMAWSRFSFAGLRQDMVRLMTW